MNAFSFDFSDASLIDSIVGQMNQFSLEHSESKNSPFVYEFNASIGRKYIKITRGYGGSNSAWCFIDADGMLWKPASYNAPTKNFPRGTIEDLRNEQFVMNNIYGF